MRKSFIFLAFILVFALGQGVFAQSCEIGITSVAPLSGGGKIITATQTTVTIYAYGDCLPAGDGYSPTNGFVLYSDPTDPDGQAGFGQVNGALTAAFTSLTFDFGPFNNYFKWDGGAWAKQVAPFSTVAGDSVAVMWGGVASGPGHGMVSTFHNNALTFTFTVPEGDSNKTVCIDQSLTGVPGAVWKWAPVVVANPTIYPDWSGLQCFETEFIPNQNPEVQNCPGDVNADHCSPYTFNFEVTDPDPDPVSSGVVSTGPGTLTANGDIGGGVWSFTYTLNPVPIGPTVVGFTFDDGIAPDAVETCSFTITGTNAAPVCSAPAGPLSVSAGTAKTQTVTATDDCDVMTYSLGATLLDGSPAVPAGSLNITTAGDDLSADVTFNPVAADEGVWDIAVVVSDGDQQSTCHVFFEVIIGGAYGVEIEKLHDVLQGNMTQMAVMLTKMDTTQGLGGFDFLIAYDPTCLLFQQAIEAPGLYGDAPNCGWEYFTYRFGPYGNCGSGCPSGMVQVIGMAETNDGANHPTCDVPFAPDPLADPPTTLTMFYLKFLVSNDRTLNCQLCPVRFFWYDCTNNALSNADGSKLYTSVGVYDYDNPNPINSLDVEFPTYLGAQEECYDGKKDTAEANVDFQNGGVDIVCSDSIDAPGDININGLAYEIADAVMFTNYFIQGPSAFGTHIDASIAASDANLDGVPLTVSDLVYLIRVVVGDAVPYAKVGSIAASYSNASGVLSVDGDMGAALVVVEGTATATGLNGVQVQQGMVDHNTQILVTGYDAEANTFTAFNGDFLEVSGNVISVEFAAADGSMVNANNVPMNFQVYQNYPNPFNPTTKITFDNPANKAWNVTIYNIAGQTVDRFAGENGTRVELDWDASNLASGIYFYKVVAGDNVQTKKAVLLK
jgi:hypothetical protein